jgi:hypothetical protein
VLSVLLVNVIMLSLLEIPLIGYTVAPDWTPRAVERFKDFVARHARRVFFRLALTIGILLIVRGLIYIV